MATKEQIGWFRSETRKRIPPTAWRLLNDICDAAERCAALEAQNKKVRCALENLYALVRGECPSLLDGDHHDDMVRAALESEATDG